MTKMYKPALRRKLHQKMAEYEEQLEALLSKCSNLEKQKSRLQSEVEILIMDLEKVITNFKKESRFFMLK